MNIRMRGLAVADALHPIDMSKGFQVVYSSRFSNSAGFIRANIVAATAALTADLHNAREPIITPAASRVAVFMEISA